MFQNMPNFLDVIICKGPRNGWKANHVGPPLIKDNLKMKNLFCETNLSIIISNKVETILQLDRAIIVQ